MSQKVKVKVNVTYWDPTHKTEFFFCETIVQKPSLKHFIRAPSVPLGRQ